MPSPNYKRLIGIDFGTKRIGAAKSDPLGMFAQPIGTFDMQGLLEALSRIQKEDGIEKIVVGYPLSYLGETNRLTGVVDAFIGELGLALPGLPIVTADEHHSSADARKILYDTGASRKKRNVKGRLDTAAACVILQQYLDAHS